jgi:hypothetical protein
MLRVGFESSTPVLEDNDAASTCIAPTGRAVHESLILTDLEESRRDLMEISTNLHGMTE